MMTNFRERMIVGCSASLVAVLLIILSFNPLFKFLFVAVVTALAAVAVWEYYKATEQKGYRPISRLGVAATIAYSLSVYLSTYDGPWVHLPLATLWCTGFLLFGYHFLWGSRPLENLSVTAFGITYIAIPISFLITINFFGAPGHHDNGRYWLLYLILVTKMTDTGAYFTGRSLGKRPLAPVLSPRKTIEGAIGGTLAAIVASALFAFLSENTPILPTVGLPVMTSVWLGAAVAIAAQVGDLSESLIKRDTGVKDSNHLPGLGGILDIADSLIFTGPMVYLFLVCGVIG